ncbi:MAG: glucosamine-6-phosphate deaminase [Clostridia bacterium]|nr:glucosamine-6-phosphate deaminase [Clostridia bacterium]
MKVVRCKTYEEMSLAAAQMMAEQIKSKPDSVLGLATGSTPVGMYAELVRQHKAGELDFSGITTVNLDEYCGLAGDHPQSYRYFMQQNLFDHVNVDPAKTHVPCGTAEDLDEEAAEYEKMVASLGYADLQLLGVGPNGHIGFNEPADSLLTDTHVTPLAKETIRANARFFNSEDEVPKYALSMGIGTIFGAKKIMILINGKAKRDALAALLAGDVVDTHCPVTLLHLHHDVTVFCDDEAWPYQD